jgi:hypothetical protein
MPPAMGRRKHEIYKPVARDFNPRGVENEEP